MVRRNALLALALALLSAFPSARASAQGCILKPAIDGGHGWNLAAADFQVDLYNLVLVSSVSVDGFIQYGSSSDPYTSLTLSSGSPLAVTVHTFAWGFSSSSYFEIEFCPYVAPTATSTSTPTATATSTSTPTPTATSTSTPTPTAIEFVTVTPSPTLVPSPVPTVASDILLADIRDVQTNNFKWGLFTGVVGLGLLTLLFVRLR